MAESVDAGLGPGMNPGMGPEMDEERGQTEGAVTRVETELVDAEVALETLRVELSHFAHDHHRRLGALYIRLDELDAEVAEKVALRTGDPQDLRRAREARARVEEAAPDQKADGAQEAAGDGAGPGRQERVRIRPSKEAQRLYRELARRAHPDLAQDPGEKERREQFIRRVNDAYANSNVELLGRLAEEWAMAPDAAPPPTSPKRTGWLRSRLAWLEARLAELRAEQAALEASPLAQLLSLDPDDPDGLLDRLGEQLTEQIGRYEEMLRRTSEFS